MIQSKCILRLGLSWKNNNKTVIKRKVYILSKSHVNCQCKDAIKKILVYGESKGLQPMKLNNSQFLILLPNQFSLKWLWCKLLLLLNGKYIINNNEVSAHDTNCRVNYSIMPSPDISHIYILPSNFQFDQNVRETKALLIHI
jgi:hypothetical protein